MHIIRLRQPWQATWRDQPTNAPTASSYISPLPRVAHYLRQFHRPSGLSEHQTVTLVLQATSGVSLNLQLDEDQPQPATAQAPTTEEKPKYIATDCTVEIHSILLNSRPLSLSNTASDTQFITYISAPFASILQPFNQLEIVCDMAGWEPVDNEIANVLDADVSAAEPPALPQWVEVRLEIHG